MNTEVITTNVTATLESIFETVMALHDPSLVKQRESPSRPNYDPQTSPASNTIYHIYNDGQITNQKGAWAYMDRSEFNTEYGIGYRFDNTRFPKHCDNIGWAIVTLSDARVIRKMMVDYYDTMRA